MTKKRLLIIATLLLAAALATVLTFYLLGYRIDIILVYPISPSDLTPAVERIT
jgi:hypothetical protein